MSFKINHGQMYPLEDMRGNSTVKRAKEKNNTFENILQQQIEKAHGQIKISSHAQKRLSQRNISLNDKDIEALKRGMDQAHAKGSRESLLLYKDMAFITSIRNRTIITAVDQDSAKENVFTNIDSAVIVK